MKLDKEKYARVVVFTIREIQTLIMQKTYCKQEKCEENHPVPVRKKNVRYVTLSIGSITFKFVTCVLFADFKKV